MPGLARGLGALIPQKESLTAQILPEAQEGFQEILVSSIVENPYQPRSQFSASDMEDLVASIKEHGILQPLVVTRKGGAFELVAGERRLRAAKSLGLAKVPAIVRTASEQQKLELALIENIQRQQLNALEEAIAYRALIDEFHLTQSDVADRVGKSRSEVANTLRLLDLPEEAKHALREGLITRSHARTLLAETDPRKRLELLEAMRQGKLTVRAAEHVSSKRASPSKKGSYNPNMAAHEQRLREVIGTKVEIKERAGKGTISIHFFSKEELVDLLQRLTDLS